MKEESINIIYDLYKFNRLNEETPRECYLYIALYYGITKIKQMQKYLLLAIEDKNMFAARILADYYHQINKLDQATKYYQMAIDYGDVDSIIKLASVYQTQKDYSNVYKYLRLAFENGKYNAIIDLLEMYLSIGDQKCVSIIDFIIVEKNNTIALKEIARYYQCTHYE